MNELHILYKKISYDEKELVFSSENLTDVKNKKQFFIDRNPSLKNSFIIRHYKENKKIEYKITLFCIYNENCNLYEVDTIVSSINLLGFFKLNCNDLKIRRKKSENKNKLEVVFYLASYNESDAINESINIFNSMNYEKYIK